MARGKAHSDETKAAVMAALLAGQSVSRVAEEYNLPAQTVSQWAKSVQFGEVRNKKEFRIPELVAEHLETLLQGMTGIVSNASRADYIAKQPASEVAVLYGVFADKAFRLLAATPVGDAAEPGITEQEAAA